MAQVSLPSRKRARMTETEGRCVACIGLFSSRGLQELQSEYGYAHRTRQEAEASAQEGCALCEFLVRAGESKFGEDKWSAGDRLVFQSQSESEEQASELTVLQGRIGSSNEVLTIYPFAQEGDPLAALIPRREVKRDVKSSAVFAAARRLIHACLRSDKPSKGHQLCRYSRDTVLPTRVLNVGKSRNINSPVRLQVNEVETHGEYLALSYCWGQQSSEPAVQPLLLRRNSLHDLASEILPGSLQQSIRDAIYVTRRLGYDYLWVDALCIIQDDDKDKERELSMMATIYKNAIITLAAGTATSASEGFLGKHASKPNIYLPEHKFAIPMESEDQIGHVYLSAEPYEPHHPLDKRGWTLQEFMLSSRMLIFSDYQLLWQCKEVELRSVTGDSRGLEYQQPLESLPWTVFDEEEPRFGAFDSEKLYMWKTIIRQYTERNLSVPGDRLLAVSGITTELAKLWKDSNVWGLWRKWFIPLLAWFKVEIDGADKRTLSRAPSWSWASLDGGICYQDRKIDATIDVEDAKIKTLTETIVELSCRILNADDADDADAPVSERPDLGYKAWREEVGEKDMLYLLLGTTKGDDHGGKGLGIALLVIQVANKRYRRIGLAVFPDMSIWKGVERQTVEFEPKQ